MYEWGSCKTMTFLILFSNCERRKDLLYFSGRGSFLFATIFTRWHNLCIGLATLVRMISVMLRSVVVPKLLPDTK